ncbi:MAG TPA: VOC family protein [Thermomicrobiales bacterium]|jgi:glyoxalase family protein|nr:VOC family protein [Thermomicrobiales bacterium]
MTSQPLPPLNPRHAITGIHHVTAVATDIPRAIDWYTRTLGLHLVKRTIDTDDWQSYHVFVSTEPTGQPGTLLSLLEWKDSRKGTPGIGGTHHVAFATADRESLLRWKRWLTDHGNPVDGPYDRTYFTSIYTKDPDGLIVEIATVGPGWTVDETADHLGEAVQPPPFQTTAAGRDEQAIAAETWPVPVLAIDDAMRLSRLHHVTAIGTNQAGMEAFWSDLLGMRLVKRTINFDDPDSPHLYWGVEDGAPGTIVTFFVWPTAGRKAARLGTGQTHHFALTVPDDSLGYWIERLTGAGTRTTPIRDQTYTRGVLFQNPDGHILELATSSPGMTVDERADALGRDLMLPPRLAAQRERIEVSLGLSPDPFHRDET